MPRATVNGCELFYVVDDYTDPWIPHEAVLMHHGFARSHRWLYGWVPTLARHYAVVRFDARGMGDSQSAPWDFPWSLEAFSDDVLGLMNVLGLEKVHFIGDSMGGLVGATFAAKHSDRLHTLVLCTTPPVLNFGPIPGYKDRISGILALGHWGASPLRKLSPAQSQDPIERSKNAWILMEYKRTPLQVGLAREEWLKRPSSTDITGLLPQIQAPTLVLSPGKVSSERLAKQKMIAQGIPNSRHVVIDEAVDSYISLDFPDRCAAAALEFIRAHQA